LCLIVAVVGLTALSEIGVNVAPLLAGAGIVGIAIGFGSQKLVQDLITGLFLLLENGVQVGDNVSVAGLSGNVENVSIRTIRLRAADGSVHIIPFSAVTTITNASRGAGNAAVSVSVAYKEDTDRASQILKDIVAEMRREAEYRQAIRGDLELWGVDKVDGSMATIVGQIRCTDSGRWPVQREFNRRMKRRFQEYGIEIASTGQTILMQVPAPPADVTPDAMPRRAAG
jgi:small-conductance mechanosensitive channel